uniref:Uncharacterized protein n=1 Tax=Ditylum brightwellii TaxID=49249 RepID=A0A7S4W1B5_9STRA
MSSKEEEKEPSSSSPPTKRIRLTHDDDDAENTNSNNPISNQTTTTTAESDDDDDDATALKPIRSNVLINADAYKKSYCTATPYPHGVIDSLFVDGFLEKVLDEIKQNSKVKFKESDLFRVYQSIDLVRKRKYIYLVCFFFILCF